MPSLGPLGSSGQVQHLEGFLDLAAGLVRDHKPLEPRQGEPRQPNKP